MLSSEVKRFYGSPEQIFHAKRQRPQSRIKEFAVLALRLGGFA
jgi:hypothetical protein